MSGKWQSIKFRLFSIIMILLMILTTGMSACTPKPKNTEIVLGALLPLTGKLSSTGESAQAGLEIATSDINEYLESIDSRVRMNLIVEDTETDTTIALEKLKGLAKKDVKIVIGPDPSIEVEAVKAYAEGNSILLISHASTAPSLAIPGDNVFRLCPDDSHQAEATAKLMWEDGIRAVVAMWRGDVWGDDLSKATRGSFEQLGGTVFGGVRYSPTTDDFSSEIESLSSKVSQAVAQYGASAVAVHLMAFEEVVPIFSQLEQQNTILSTIKWYGSDGSALNKVLIDNVPAARFAVITDFSNPTHGAGQTEEYILVMEQVQKKIGRTPEYSAFSAYDALWLATKTYLVTGTKEPDALKKALRQEAGQYFGATGWTILNEVGDREFGDYDFWAVKEENGAFQWQRVARYQSDPGLPERLITELGFPSRPIRIISGWTGGTVTFLEAVAQNAEKIIGMPLVVVSKVGNEGLDAITEFQAAPTDGYTLFFFADITITPFVQGKIAFNPTEDMVPLLIGNLAVSQIYIRADDGRYSNWDKLVTYAREHPGLKVAMVGTPLDMEGLLITNLEQAFNLQFEQRAYEKSSERYAAFMSGQTDILIEQIGDVRKFVEGGEFKPVLTLWNERVKGFEDVPTAVENGDDFIPLLRLRGLAAPKGTPQERIDYLKEVLQTIFNSEGFQEYLRENSLDLVPYPDDPTAYVREQIETYRKWNK
ncbi:penicillin-binding protein activator [Chloroflexota bacterium]